MSARDYQPPYRRAIGYIVLTFFALLFIGPFVITIATSFKTDADATSNPLSLIPHPPTLAAWRRSSASAPHL